MAFVFGGVAVRAERRQTNCVQRRVRAVVVASVGGDVTAGFVQVCAGPKPYQEAIAEFVGAVVEAYQKGYSMTALQMEMQMEKARELQADEVELRTIYVTLVYKTLLILGVKQKPGTSKVESLPGPFDSFIQQIVEATRRGYSLERIRLQLNLNNEENRNSTESAILQQGSRLVFETAMYIRDRGLN
eukprot:Plantae.Rhodophyta-Purpureofilum_apyrenoidigerum.ctg48026.p1 GENE.Plantae.Rhodophyta-Purpureofilum_apyrenoidigerum.ctg48026~~Plantae.Rhodophyta-Purpureofilum_apyrenoidigerum.ctg48026.p1  ORF type:complete len:203 (+),score=40.32 Plantae.Rhodophyta-Purpureofilum_apyrenoidigerum.ctg48026:51-611(+)